MKKTLVLLMAAVSCATTLSAQEALLRAGDVLELRISGVPSDEQSTINGTYTLDGEGFFNLSLIGKIRGAGRTVSQTQSAVEGGYRDQGYFSHPTISISVPTTARFVNVGGQGINGGGKRLAYTPDLTLMSAITAAGDLNEFADRKHVNLIRNKKVTVYDLRVLQKDPSKDPSMLPGDSIAVPQSPW